MKRSICIWLSFAVIFVLTMFPPWVKTATYPGGLTRRWRLGHAREDLPPAAVLPDLVDVDYRRMLTEIGAGESFVLALYLTWGRMGPKRRSWAPVPPISKAKVQDEQAGLAEAGRQSLRLKVGYDEEKIDRLIEYEREKLGDLPLHILMAAAGERWERDNR